MTQRATQGQEEFCSMTMLDAISPAVELGLPWDGGEFVDQRVMGGPIQWYLGPREWKQGPSQQYLGSWGWKGGSREERQSLAAGVIQVGSGAGGSIVRRQPSWNSRSGLRRRIVRGYFDARVPTSNQIQNYPPGNIYTSVDRVDSNNRRQLDILSGLGGILGSLPG